MRILPSILGELAPTLKRLSIETLAERLTLLGLEAEILPGEIPVLELSVTPNRADGMSHLGVTRDLLAYQYRELDQAPVALTLSSEETWEHWPELDTPRVIVAPPGAAPQYHALLIDNVTIQPSPAWIQEQLTLLGIRPINNVVDLTNYLMELYGQPLHAFDADALLGEELTVRDSREGETLETLDGKTHILPKGVAVIQDRDGLVDLAGIMGGANSQVQSGTTRILLQAAIFDRTRIRRAANALNHRTPAATRYERGVDPAVGIPVLERAAALLRQKEFGGSRVVGKIAVTSRTRTPKPIVVDPAHVNNLLGMTVATKRQQRYLELIGATITPTEGGYGVVAPSWRFDLEIWQDVAEEIARLIGFDTELPAKSLYSWTAQLPRSEIEWAEGLKDRLVELGLSEIQTYSFISGDDLRRFELPNVGELANPLNPTLRFLRPSLLPNLARVIATNGMFDPIRIFEIGHVFSEAGESLSLGIALAGEKIRPTEWLVRLADAIGMDSAELTDKVRVHELSQQVKDSYKIRKRHVALFEVPLSALASARRIPTNYVIPTVREAYTPISKYPPITRDVASIVPRELTATTIAQHIRRFDDRIELVELFDEFISDSLGVGKKSLAFHIYYASPDQTLTDEEIEELHRALEHSLVATFNATIR